MVRVKKEKIEKLVTLQTSDLQQFTVKRSIIRQSNLIRGILDDLEDTGEVIPLPNITGSVFEIVLKYAELHKDDKKNEESSSAPEQKSLEVEDRDKAIVDVPKKMLFDIILAANYLDYSGLLDLGCKMIANDLKGKTIDEVVRDYDVPPERQFTPEEREKIQRELDWADGKTLA